AVLLRGSSPQHLLRQIGLPELVVAGTGLRGPLLPEVLGAAARRSARPGGARTARRAAGPRGRVVGAGRGTRRLLRRGLHGLRGPGGWRLHVRTLLDSGDPVLPRPARMVDRAAAER